MNKISLHKLTTAILSGYLVLINSFFSFAQNVNDNLRVNTYCTTSYSSSGCASFKNTCGANSGWTSSNGTPQLIFWAVGKNPNDLPRDYMQMIANGNSSEGAFYPYTFTAGYWYTVSVDLSSTGGPGYFSFYAATGLGQHLSTGGCQESPAIQTTTARQLFGTITGPGNNYQTTFNMTFKANATYKQFWMYVTGTGGSTFNGTVTNVQINTLWNTSCLPPSFVNSSSPATGQINVWWGSVSGATSYNISFTDATQVGNNAAFYNFIPAVAPENGVNFTGIPRGALTVNVQATCANGQTSSWATASNNVQVNTENRLLQGTSTLETTYNKDSLSYEAEMFKAFPSPASSQVTISYNGNQNSNGNISIFNQQGEKVFDKNVLVSEGRNNYILDVSPLAAGVYVIKIYDHYTSHVTKLMIAK